MRLSVVLFSTIAACCKASSGALNWPPFDNVHDTVWMEMSRDVRCMTSMGNWKLNAERRIKDDILYYAPCPVVYPRSNYCNWTLDGNALKYDWQPESHCGVNLQPLDAKKMCSLMEGAGNVMMVGDYNTGLAARSWENKLLSGMQAKCPYDPASEPPLIRHVCESNVGIIFVRNDYVSLTTKLIWERKKSFQWPWIDVLDRSNVSLLVLNRGVHYKDDDHLIAEVNATLHYVTTQHPHISIIWRNTPHGDLDFANHVFSPPLTIPPELSEDAPFHYGLFKHQNALVGNLIVEHYPRVLYLDAFTSAVLRLDGRHDALHPCIPGFLDTWLQFIYNALLLLAQYHSEFVLQQARG